MARLRNYLMAACIVVIVASVAEYSAWLWMQREWFDIQSQQIATIEPIGDFPPEGWDRSDWQNALITPCNVWGNETFQPDHSNFNCDEMRLLQQELEQIVSETT